MLTEVSGSRTRLQPCLQVSLFRTFRSDPSHGRFLSLCAASLFFVAGEMPLKNLCSCRFLHTALNSVASDMPLKNLPCSCRFLHTALFSVIGENSVRNVPRSCRSVLQALFRLAGEMSMRNVPRSCRFVLQPCSESWSRRNAAPSTWASVTLPSP